MLGVETDLNFVIFFVILRKDGRITKKQLRIYWEEEKCPFNIKKYLKKCSRNKS